MVIGTIRFPAIRLPLSSFPSPRTKNKIYLFENVDDDKKK